MVLADKGCAYHSEMRVQAYEARVLIPKAINPYTPRTSGKAKRFIKSMLSELARGMIFQSSAKRKHWLVCYLGIDKPEGATSPWRAASSINSSVCCGLVNDLVRKQP